MKFAQKSPWSKIILLCLSLTVIEKGWVRKTYPFELGTLVFTQEVLYGLTLACSMIWRACNNANDSAVDRILRDQINKISNNCSVSDPNLITSARRSKQQISSVSAAQQRQPLFIIKPVLVRLLSPELVQNISNINKARAMAMQIIHQQTVKATYADLPEETKTASQELLDNVAIDWRKQLVRSCSESIGYARTHTYNQLHMYMQELNSTWTAENNNKGGITYRASNQQAYFSINPKEQHRVVPPAETPEHFERMVIDLNPEFCIPVQKVIQAFVKNAQSLVYGSLPERVAALLSLNSFSINGITYGQEII